jgi:phenylalanyl-tRNA synthetase beta chain
VNADAKQVEVVPPSWRRDLTREIDLVEEVARIHGYDAIPEDVNVPMAASHRTHRDRVLAKVREALVAAGVDEAMTISVVDEAASEAFSPWSNAPPLVASTPVLRRANRLRRSLIPSLLEARRNNEAIGNPAVNLFEIARAYLPREGQLPEEALMLGITGSGDFANVKGIVEAIVGRLATGITLEVADFQNALFRVGRAGELRLGGERLGFLGEVNAAGLKQFELREPTTVAELSVAVLEKIAQLIPKAASLSPYPAVSRDLNLVVDERVRWADLSATVCSTAGPELEEVVCRDTYRDPQRLGPDKKSQLFSILLRRSDRTLTSAEADEIRDRIVDACVKQHGAALRA